MLPIATIYKPFLKITHALYVFPSLILCFFLSLSAILFLQNPCHGSHRWHSHHQRQVAEKLHRAAERRPEQTQSAGIGPAQAIQLTPRPEWNVENDGVSCQVGRLASQRSAAGTTYGRSGTQHVRAMATFRCGLLRWLSSFLGCCHGNWSWFEQELYEKLTLWFVLLRL